MLYAVSVCVYRTQFVAADDGDGVGAFELLVQKWYVQKTWRMNGQMLFGTDYRRLEELLQLETPIVRTCAVE